MSQIKFTEYSHAAGCGCNIAPALLDDILKTTNEPVTEPRLLVAVDAAHQGNFLQFACELSQILSPLGELTDANNAQPLIGIR